MLYVATMVQQMTAEQFRSAGGPSKGRLCAGSPAPEDPGAADDPPAVDGVSLDLTVAPLGPAPPVSATSRRLLPVGSRAKL